MSMDEGRASGVEHRDRDGKEPAILYDKGYTDEFLQWKDPDRYKDGIGWGRVATAVLGGAAIAAAGDGSELAVEAGLGYAQEVLGYDGGPGADPALTVDSPLSQRVSPVWDTRLPGVFGDRPRERPPGLDPLRKRLRAFLPNQADLRPKLQGEVSRGQPVTHRSGHRGVEGDHLAILPVHFSDWF